MRQHIPRETILQDIMKFSYLRRIIPEKHFEQLKVYAALFCLEYKQKPAMIDIELRVYKKDEVAICNPDSDEIVHIMNHIVHLDKLLAKIDNEEV